MLGLTLVQTRALFLRVLCLDHLPQILPTSLWPAPPSRPTRRWGRGTSRDTSLLCPSLILRPGRAKTPALFGLKPGPYWNKGFEGCWARLRLPKLLDHHLNRYRKSRKVRLEHREESPFFPISARFIHRCLSVTTMAAIDLPIAVAASLVAWRAKSVVRCSSATSSGDKPLTLIQVF